MGVTVMIIMGLLSMLAFSTLDLDLEQLQELRDRALAAGDDDEEEFVDTSELGWLDVPEDLQSTSFEGIERILSQTTEDDGASSTETGQETAFGEDTEDTDGTEQMVFGAEHGIDQDLWPRADQSTADEADTDIQVTQENDAEDTPQRLADFNAEEDALELPYVPKKDASGSDIVPDVSVTHYAGYTNINVDDAVHSFGHLEGSNFQALKPEDILLRVA